MTIEGFIEPSALEKVVYDKLKNKGITRYDYPINPYKLIENEGIILREMDFGNENIRGMIVNGDNATGIVINNNRSYVSKRFIAMHELFHYWFHPRKLKTICLENYRKSKKGFEWQANNAAAYALMPKDVLLELYDYCHGDLEFICKELQVSKDSLNYRLGELEIDPIFDIKYSDINKRDHRLVSLEDEWLYGLL